MTNQTFIDRALQHLEMAINSTPTGPIRDKLTEANIFLMVADSMNKKDSSENSP